MSAPRVGWTQTGASWAWRGAHRGAGVTTLSRRLGGVDLGTLPSGSFPTLVVCRDSADGLIAAQHVAATELANPPVDSPKWECVGLVIVASGPKAPAGATAELMTLVTGGYPAHWLVDWEPAAAAWVAPASSVAVRASSRRPSRHLIRPSNHPTANEKKEQI